MPSDHREPAYSDDDLMDFGRYKDERLSEVPASYFHWIHVNGVRLHDKKLHNYIYNNLAAFKQEDPDLIWGRL